MNFQEVRHQLKEHNLEIFTSQDFANIFNLSREFSAVKLTRYKGRGYLVSPRRGVYYLKGEVSDKFKVANKVYRPSYISMDTALSKYAIIPETVYAITSVTTKATREFADDQTVYKYYRIKRSAYIGYVLVNDTFIAEPEKAVTDYLYFVAIGKRVLNDRMNPDKLVKDKVFYYAKYFDDKRLDNLLNKLFK